MSTNVHTATIAELLASGYTVTLAKGVVSSNAPASVHTTLPMEGDVVKVVSLRGCVLRQFRPETASDRKIAQAMRICAAEGWHLWEMQFAMYCAENGIDPEYANKPASLAAFEPMNYKRFSFVRKAFLNYARLKKAGIIGKLIAM